MDRTYDDVARRAYDLFLSRGGQHGHDVDDWLEAEQQLARMSVPPPAPRRVASAARATKTAGKARARARA